MMRLRWAAVLGVVLAAAAAVAENPCTPSTPVANQKRTGMKHREPASSGTHVEATTVAEMISWEQPDELSDRDVRSSNSPIDPREEEVLVLEGDLWRIAEEANDCDYHLEISAPARTTKRTGSSSKCLAIQPSRRLATTCLQRLAQQIVRSWRTAARSCSTSRCA
jgi:hypothetical protein